MRNELNFSYNWNNKLTGKFFTTLRLKDENRFKVGETHAIMLQRKLIAYADIVAVRHMFLRDINDYVAGLDTGYSADECRKMITTMYKKSNIDWEKRQLTLVLFRKHKNTVESHETNPQLQESA